MIAADPSAMRAPTPSAPQPDALDLPMRERLAHAAARLETPRSAATTSALRAEQVRVADDFARYLLDVVTRPERERAAPFCRIILPPRTGKTVIAAHLVVRSGLGAVFIVPTRALVEQTVREFRTHAPGVPVGAWYGDRKDLADRGVNVTTYALFAKDAETGALPAQITGAALVFVDEAHHAMTTARMTALRTVFDANAIRVGLTATPDWNEERRLAHHFPELIHEIGLTEAVDLGLLAPMRVWVAEVDADASLVRLVGGDFDAETLGRVMSSAPFFRAVELFRYATSNAAMPCLVACSSRRQAHDLVAYLAKHRPRGKPRPALVLGDTPGAERERILAEFERGTIDTLVQVGVLVEGWSSPRCKLLIDLAPTVSRVRATQKFFRVATRSGDAEARIYMLLPRDLERTPVLPMDLFVSLRDVYTCGELLGPADTNAAPSEPIDPLAGTPVDGVVVKNRILLAGRVEKPTLDPRNLRDVRRVLESAEGFDPENPCGVQRVRWLLFRHRLFTGRGESLLRWLDVAPTREGWICLLARVYPERAGEWFLREREVVDAERPCSVDAANLCHALLRPDGPASLRDAVAGWRAATGVPAEIEATPEQILLVRERNARLRDLVTRLKRRRRRIVERWTGLDGDAAETLDELGAALGITGSRVRQIVARSTETLLYFIATDVHEDLFEEQLAPWRRARAAARLLADEARRGAVDAAASATAVAFEPANDDDDPSPAENGDDG